MPHSDAVQKRIKKLNEAVESLIGEIDAKISIESDHTTLGKNYLTIMIAFRLLERAKYVELNRLYGN